MTDRKKLKMYNNDAYFVVRDCVNDANYLINDFCKACAKAKELTVKHFGNKYVVFGAIIFYKEKGIPKYCATCRAISENDVSIKWYAPNDNLLYVLQENMINPL